MNNKIESSQLIPGNKSIENTPEKSKAVDQVINQISQNLLELVPASSKFLQTIKEALFCLAQAKNLTRLSPAMAKLFMATALTLFCLACDDSPNQSENDTDQQDVKIYEIDTNIEDKTDSTPIDSFFPNELELDHETELDSIEKPDEEDIIPLPEITKILQEDLLWQGYNSVPTNPYIRINKLPIPDCRPNSNCPYDEFFDGPQPEPDENQNHIILSNPIPTDTTDGNESTRLVEIANYEICSSGDDLIFTSISGEQIWRTNNPVRYDITLPPGVQTNDGENSITRIFDTQSDVQRIANENGLFTKIPDGECFDVQVSLEMEEGKAPNFSATQYKLTNIGTKQAPSTMEPVQSYDEFGHSEPFKHSIIIGAPSNSFSIQTDWGTNIPLNISLNTPIFPCVPTEDTPISGPKALQFLYFRPQLDSIIENLIFPELTITSDKPGKYTFEIEVNISHSNSNAHIMTQTFEIDFSENHKNELSLPYSIDLLPGQFMLYQVSLANIEEINKTDTPTFEIILKEDGLKTVNNENFNATLFIRGEIPYEKTENYNPNNEYTIQHATFSEPPPNENYVQIRKDLAQPINDDRESFALNKQRLETGCYEQASQERGPCPIAGLRLSINEFLRLANGQISGSEEPYALQRYKFNIVSTGFSEPVPATIVLNTWDQEIWSQKFEIKNGMVDYYLVTENDPSLNSSAIQILLPPEGISGLKGCTEYTLRFFVDSEIPITTTEQKLTQFIQPSQIQVTHKELILDTLEVIYEGKDAPGSFETIIGNLKDIGEVKAPKIVFEDPYALVDTCSPPYTITQSGDDAVLFCLEVLETNGPSALSDTEYGMNSDWTLPASIIYEMIKNPEGTTNFWYPEQWTTLASWNATEQRVVFSDGQQYSWNIKIAPENSPINNRRTETTLKVKADDLKQLRYEGGEPPNPGDAFIIIEMQHMALCDTAFGCEEEESGIIPVYTTYMDPDTYQITLSEITEENPLPGPIVFINE